MAPLPVIGNCVRVGLRWLQSGGVQPYNVFHLITDQDDLDQLGLDIGAAITDATTQIFADVAEAFSVGSVDLTPLDGTTPTTQHGLGTTFTGGTGGQWTPQVCALVSMKSNQRGPRGRGRLYLGPLAEGAINNGSIASYGTMTTAWNDFMESLASSDSAASLGIASYTHADVHGVTSLVVQQLSATQRRRMSQLRR